jgi:isoprenylcysteine carboxyl methyltransferase (ICMT) family protein YpbQ
MRCRKSQDREHKRDGASGYGKDHNAVVRKKHGVHLWALLTQSDAQATEFRAKGSDGVTIVRLVVD